MTLDQNLASRPALSILIPSIPERTDKAIALYKRVSGMFAENEDVEILLLMDNKKRSIGEKRNALKNIANGLYFMILDDDDDVTEHVYDVYAHASIIANGSSDPVDVISFKQLCKNSDGSEFIVTFGLGNDVEHNTDEKGMYKDIKRPPFHVCAWHCKFKVFAFSDKNFGEDWDFVRAATEIAKTETFVDKIVHRYNFDPNVSTVSNDDDNAAQLKLFSDTSLTPEEQWKEEQSKPVVKNKMAIVNLITEGEQRYEMGQKRLEESLKVYCPDTIDCFFFQCEHSVGSPSHKENPYAFKLYAIDHVRRLGYDQVLWLDASIVAVKDVMPLFDHIKENELFFEHSGWKAGQWTNDNCLDIMQVSRDDAWKMPMFAAGYVGFDFTSRIADVFFGKWYHYMNFGAFKGEWTDHRHDMSVGSILANTMGLLELYCPEQQYFSYIGEAYPNPNPNSIFHLLGL